MDTAMSCWKCKANLDDVELPLRRSELCPGCTADLHVCHMCRHFDPDAQRGCREPVAEEVRDRTRANFCGWFQIGSAVAGSQSTNAVGTNELESLFGLDANSVSTSPAGADAAKRAFDDMFDDSSNRS